MAIMSPEESFLISALSAVIAAHLLILASRPTVAAFLRVFPPLLSHRRQSGPPPGSSASGWDMSICWQRYSLLILRVFTGLGITSALVLLSCARFTFWLSTVFLQPLCQTTWFDFSCCTVSATEVSLTLSKRSSTVTPLGSSSMSFRILIFSRRFLSVLSYSSGYLFIRVLLNGLTSGSEDVDWQRRQSSQFLSMFHTWKISKPGLKRWLTAKATQCFKDP